LAAAWISKKQLFNSQQEQEVGLFLTATSSTLGSTHPFTQLVQENPFARTKRSGREADNLLHR